MSMKENTAGLEKGTVRTDEPEKSQRNKKGKKQGQKEVLLYHQDAQWSLPRGHTVSVPDPCDLTSLELVDLPTAM